jgi:hypothetical protein
MLTLRLHVRRRSYLEFSDQDDLWRNTWTTARLDPRRGVGTCSRHARLSCAIGHIGRQVVIKH